MAQTVKLLSAMQETQVRSLGWEDPLEKEMATHSSILAWRIPGTEEPTGLPSVGLHRVGLMRLSSSSSSQSYGFPVVMYGCESWTMLTKKDVQLESCELSFI